MSYHHVLFLITLCVQMYGPADLVGVENAVVVRVRRLAPRPAAHETHGRRDGRQHRQAEGSKVDDFGDGGAIRLLRYTVDRDVFKDREDDAHEHERQVRVHVRHVRYPRQRVVHAKVEGDDREGEGGGDPDSIAHLEGVDPVAAPAHGVDEEARHLVMQGRRGA